MNARRRWMVLVLGVCVLTAIGCSDGDDPLDINGPTQPESYPFAGSPEQLMANFKDAHEERNYTEYLVLLDPGFLLFLLQETVDEFSLPSKYFDHAEDVRITEMMFSGNPPDEGVGAITDIDFMTLRQIDTWEPTGNAEFPGALESQYDVSWQITQTQSDGSPKVISINGRIVFFLSTDQVKIQGNTRTRYKLVGMIDETNIGTKADVVPIQDFPWGSVKALYRPAATSR